MEQPAVNPCCKKFLGKERKKEKKKQAQRSSLNSIYWYINIFLEAK